MGCPKFFPQIRVVLVLQQQVAVGIWIEAVLVPKAAWRCRGSATIWKVIQLYLTKNLSLNELNHKEFFNLHFSKV